MSQYGMAHFLHLYAPLYPHTEHKRRGGSWGGGAAAVKYVGTWQGRFAMRDSSIRVARFLRYRSAVRTFIDDFFFFALGSFKWRLSETIWRTRFFPLIAPSSLSSRVIEGSV
jgi:hypothetical protein